MAFSELQQWTMSPPDTRATILSGARQVGKTTLFLQLIRHLLDEDVPAANILYLSLDHPFLKLTQLDQILEMWREIIPPGPGLEYIFVDEIQNVEHWETWLKHQIDFKGDMRRIAVTGSAAPLHTKNAESGVGRWHTIKLPTLSFFEFLRIRDQKLPAIAEDLSLYQLGKQQQSELNNIALQFKEYTTHFHDYLLRGGFPRTAKVAELDEAQKLLREDIVDKVLKRDMTALFGVRNIVQLESVFFYLCMHQGGEINVSKLSKTMEITIPTVNRYIDLFEASNFLYKLRPFKYGKEVLRGRIKTYIADPSIPESILMKGRSLLQDPVRLGFAVENAFFKHLFTRYYRETLALSYWKNAEGHEVDIIASMAEDLFPFEVKYRQSRVNTSKLKGLQDFCQQRSVERAYLITRDLNDIGVEKLSLTTTLVRIPAVIACYLLSASEQSLLE